MNVTVRMLRTYGTLVAGKLYLLPVKLASELITAGKAEKIHGDRSHHGS